VQVWGNCMVCNLHGHESGNIKATFAHIVIFKVLIIHE